MTFPYHYDSALPEDWRYENVKPALESKGLKWVHSIPKEELQLAEEIWMFPDGQSAARYVFDHFVDVPSIRTESKINGLPTQLAMSLEGVLHLTYVEDLTNQASSQDPSERGYAMRALAVITPIFRGDVFDVLRDGLNDPDREMRRIALRSIARWPYFQFVKELEALMGREEDSLLQEQIANLAADIRRSGRRG